MRRMIRKDVAVVLLVLFVLTTLVSAAVQSQDHPHSSYEYKAVYQKLLGNTEDEGTKRLNDLAQAGWDYAGPLGNGLIAFKRSTLSPKDAANPPGAHYMIFETTGKGGGLRNIPEMVSELDKLAENGWRVKTGVGYRLILEKQ